jgi:hypothetical protein
MYRSLHVLGSSQALGLEVEQIGVRELQLIFLILYKLPYITISLYHYISISPYVYIIIYSKVQYINPKNYEANASNVPYHPASDLLGRCGLARPEKGCRLASGSPFIGSISPVLKTQRKNVTNCWRYQAARWFCVFDIAVLDLSAHLFSTQIQGAKWSRVL